MVRHSDAGSIAHSGSGVARRLRDRVRLRLAGAAADRSAAGVAAAVAVPSGRGADAHDRLSVDGGPDADARRSRGPDSNGSRLRSRTPLAIWCWVFAITGLALRFLSDESPARRYLADSSYWIYLAHLPIVAAFQVLVGHLPWHWSVKFPLILAGSFAVLFASYHLLVRFTFIGAILNGRDTIGARAGAGGDVSATVRSALSERSRSNGPSSAAFTNATARPSRSPGSISKVRRGELAGGARPERRRQVDGRVAVARTARARRGHGDADGPFAARGREPPQRGGDDAGGRAPAHAHRPRARESGGELLPQSTVDRRGAGVDAHDGARGSEVRRAVGGTEAPGAIRHRDLRPAAPALSRRADGRPRRAGTRADVADACASWWRRGVRSC